MPRFDGLSVRQLATCMISSEDVCAEINVQAPVARTSRAGSSQAGSANEQCLIEPLVQPNEMRTTDLSVQAVLKP